MTALDAGCLVFDTETTAPDPEVARMVQVCAGAASVVDGHGQWDATTELVNPGVPIPEGATAVHGITDEMVAGERLEADVAADLRDGLYDAWSRGYPVLAMNACYDLTVTDRALRRAGLGGLEIGGPVIDPFVIDKACDRYRRGSRKLVDTCRVYGVPFEGDAHGAEADAYATLRVTHAMLTRLAAPRILEPSDGMIGDIPTSRRLSDWTLAQLMEAQQFWYVEQKLSLFAYFERTGQEITDRSTDWPIRPWQGSAT